MLFQNDLKLCCYHSNIILMLIRRHFKVLSRSLKIPFRIQNTDTLEAGRVWAARAARGGVGAGMGRTGRR